ncbi:acyl-ACP--UDP-N-acetylglucosamine O-acyltransferase [Amorphus orientalis]|uniref:Acyl-[acyl-carrier-protein]--UDP-N-acetylglucosamine O-acyltransferase n=1 Tax=Amorphus orientalis TaxID=649198 RepID=A0AAE4ASR8_9HYPH|nr:acyl-ACP--UDP-N-acetylglucosamine O-acyltransferase [Amorphus orientalis]MDQ0315553.1 UDP-N-acetylglucosamine acyltransferase [Amorphus orientalis]
MATIHPTAIVSEAASLGADVSIGPYSIVGPEVVLGDQVWVGSHVVIEGRTQIGAGTRIYPFASLGSPPQDLSYKGETNRIVIGENVIIREHVTINPGTARGELLTTVGDHCYLMVACHVAHDCRVGAHVILSNNVMLGGHVKVGDHVIMGGGSAVHQFVRIGDHAFVSGVTGVGDDVIPFGNVFGNRAKLMGLNLVGLKRRGFDREQIHTLRRAYRYLFSNEGTLKERLEDVTNMFGGEPLVELILDFIRSGGDRALCTPWGQGQN